MKKRKWMGHDDDLYLLHHRELIGNAPKYIILANRGDREGSNWLNKAANFLRARRWGVKVQYHTIKFGDQIFTAPFHLISEHARLKRVKNILNDHSDEMHPSCRAANVGGFCHDFRRKDALFLGITNSKNAGRHCDFRYGRLNWDNSFIQCAAHTVKLLNQDLISGFKEEMKDIFLKESNSAINKKEIKIPWSIKDKVICIHLRFGDVTRFASALPEKNRKQPFSALTPKNDRLTKTIDDEDPHVLWGGGITSRMSRWRSASSESWFDELKILIKIFKKDYPDHKVYLVAEPKNDWDGNQSRDITRKHFPGYEVYTPEKEEAIWAMINSDVLVLSRSSFSAMAGMLHRGSKVYYPPWLMFSALGLGSRFDKSGWESIHTKVV